MLIAAASPRYFPSFRKRTLLAFLLVFHIHPCSRHHLSRYHHHCDRQMHFEILGAEFLLSAAPGIAPVAAQHLKWIQTHAEKKGQRSEEQKDSIPFGYDGQTLTSDTLETQIPETA